MDTSPAPSTTGRSDEQNETDNPPDDQPGRQGAAAPDGHHDGAGESLLTVLLALAANAGVGVLKLIAGLITGSGALLSEAAHSAGDTSTELLLLTALRRSKRPADRLHPFGYGKERFFWSFLASIGILVSGAGFSIFEGVHTILSPEEHTKLVWINYVVLALAAVLEGSSLRQGVKQARGEARQRQRSVRDYLDRPNDPTVKSVVLEDSAAIVGLVFAALGVGLHQLTGQKDWDGAASIAIGLLLVFASGSLAQTSKALLIGQQADLQLIRAIEARLEDQDEVLDVVDLLTMLTGANSILLCARVDFQDSFSSADLENACVRIEAMLSDEFSELDEIFIEPVPRADPVMRQRVLSRYGRVLADEPSQAETRHSEQARSAAR